MPQCDKCKRLVSLLDSRFVPGKGVDLCPACWDKWVILQTKHVQEDREFLEKADGK